MMEAWVTIFTVGGILASSLLLLRLRKARVTAYYDGTEKLTGKTVLITGGHSGIGFWVSLDLAKRGARVVLCGRDDKAVKGKAAEIRSLSGNPDVHYYYLDLESLQSVRKFAARIVEDFGSIDILINNAGVSDAFERWKTEDGLEHTIAVNFYAPFLLTNLLYENMKHIPGARVVNVSSIAHKFENSLNIDQLNEVKVDAGRAYFRSKLCLNLFTREAARRWGVSGVTINSIHPGSTGSNLFRNFPFFLRFTFFLLTKLEILKSAEDCSHTAIFAAVSPSLSQVSGQYFSDCKRAAENRLCDDDVLRQKLWEHAQKVVGLT